MSGVFASEWAEEHWEHGLLLVAFHSSHPRDPDALRTGTRRRLASSRPTLNETGFAALSQPDQRLPFCSQPLAGRILGVEGVTSRFAQNSTLRRVHRRLTFRPSFESGFCNGNSQIWR